jgi:hypothetical protein
MKKVCLNSHCPSKDMCKLYSQRIEHQGSVRYVFNLITNVRNSCFTPFTKGGIYG